jgi:polyisoprenoid-binding protein YceI
MAQNTWVLDPSHSEVQFKVKHMMISTVSGEFKQFDVKMSADGDDFTKANAQFTASVASIDTKNEQRDGHLKSPDFFDAEHHPEVTFESKALRKKGDEEYELTGDLTMRGVTKPITLKVENSGVIKDPYGNQRTGFEISGKINRKDFGLSWNALTEAGGMVVSEDVRVSANIELIKQ